MFGKRILSMLLLMGILISQSVPRAQAQTTCDHAEFVSDLTVPDGSAFAAGVTFTKTWRLKNIGTCTWTRDYSLVWAGGELMDTPLSTKLPVEVPPGQMLDLSVNLKAPTTPANYKAFFKLSNAAGTQFGIGEAAKISFWVDINVVNVSAVIYDFVANASRAQWRSGAGNLPFPGTSGDSRGFAYQVDQPHLEDDSLDSVPGLLAVPQNKFNGYIQATYPEFQIQQGDHLQTLVNCEFGARNCYVTFRIDYLTPNGIQRTLWSWKEAYDGRFYRADIDLSSLAGQKVRFVFMLLASGFASGDRALWGSPRIVRAGSTQPPAPPATLTPLPPPPPTATPIGQPPPTIVPSGCDKAAFVTDATVPDGTIFSPGAAFTKTWRLRNTGTCTWSTSYKLIYYSGEAMNASTAVNLPWTAAPNQTVDVSVNMVAPAAAGKYRGYWILANTNGQYFGIGANATDPIWVEINVAGEAPVGTGYDFTANVCSAEWRSGAGILPCPGAEGNRNGFLLKLDAPKMEDGSTGAPGLLTVPQNRWNGYIQGFYPTFTVQPGDRFQAAIGCEQGSACYLTYRLDYVTASGYLGTFWTWREQNEGKFYNADIDLTPLAGRSVRFVLTILAAGTASNDRALWAAPRIVRAGGPTPPPVTITPTFTPTPTQTPVPLPNDWLTYTNTSFGFHFKYPPQGQISEEDFNALRMDLPFTPGTNLREKYLEMRAVEGANPCQSPYATSTMLQTSETVVINGITFLKQTGGDAGAGNIREWTAYSTSKGTLCVSMSFILHSLNINNFPEPRPPVYDKTAESVVFTQMMSTFGWTPQPGDWGTYTNAAYGFEIKYPPQSERFFETPSSILIRMPIQPGTNLVEKYLQLQAQENNSSCMLVDEGSNRELVIINGITFTKETGVSQSTGQIRKSTTFNTQQDQTCVTMTFVLHSGIPENWTPPRPVYDEAAESAVILQMMQTFTWITPVPPTPTPTWTLSPSLPDLTITQLNIELQNTSCLMPGDPLGVRLRIKNNGQAAAGSFVVRVNGVEQTVNGLGVGETTVAFFPSYSNPVTAMVDATNLIAESDENNNSRSEMVPIATPPPPCVTSTPTPSAAEFAQGVVNTLNARNFNALPAMLDQTFGFAYWQSQGTSYPSDQAIEMLRTSLTVLLISDPNKDLNALLGGTNPYSIMGLDPARSYALFVAGWGSDTQAEAILYFTQRVDGSLYWHSVLVAPTGFASQSTLKGPYAVVGIPFGYELNIHSAGGNSQPIVGSLESDAVNVMRTGPTVSVEGATWVEVQNPGGGTGWVNSYFLTEYVTHNAFCADARIATLIEQLKGSLNQSNGEMFAGIVSPVHGVDVRLWAYGTGVKNYSTTAARNIFTSTEVFNWGSGPVGGNEYGNGTFAQIIQPKVLEVVNHPNMETYCDNLTKAFPLPNAWPYRNIRYYNLYKPATPGNDFDYRTWLIGIEYIDGQPYLYSMVSIVWEP